jgi:D-glycero-D-manno-heptose 1,7-bisphosphate phosphatase
MKPAVFIDRDGTLNRMVYDETHGLFDSPRRVEQVQAMPGAGAFIQGLHQAGFTVVVVTNQPGLAKGTLTVAELEAVNRRLQELLMQEGEAWDALVYCPHHPAGTVAAYQKDCDCRKPKPGLLLKAALELGLDVRNSWMVGDGLVDVQAGRAAGCRTILVTRLKLEQVESFFSLDHAKPDYIAPDLAAAQDRILTADDGKPNKRE